MAKNEVYKIGDATAQVVPSGTLSGAPVLGNGVIPGVALTDEGKGGNVAGEASVRDTGVWRFEVPEAVANKGVKVYIKADGTLTTVATGNTLFGYAWGTKSAGAGTVAVKIAQV